MPSGSLSASQRGARTSFNLHTGLFTRDTSNTNIWNYFHKLEIPSSFSSVEVKVWQPVADTNGQSYYMSFVEKISDNVYQWLNSAETQLASPSSSTPYIYPHISIMTAGPSLYLQGTGNQRGNVFPQITNMTNNDNKVYGADSSASHVSSILPVNTYLRFSIQKTLSDPDINATCFITYFN